jgi:hypothetical protein
MFRLAFTDWYFCVCWAAGMTGPVSAVRDGPFPCFPLLSMLCFPSIVYAMLSLALLTLVCVKKKKPGRR